MSKHTGTVSTAATISEAEETATVLAPVVLCLISGGLAAVFWFTGDREGVDLGYTVLAGLAAIVAFGFAIRAARRRAAARLEDALDGLARDVQAATRLAEDVRYNREVAGDSVKGSTQKRVGEALASLDALVSAWELLPARPMRSRVGALAHGVRRASSALAKVNDRLVAETEIARRSGK